jgi:hypothetical protein
MLLGKELPVSEIAERATKPVSVWWLRKKNPTCLRD